MQISDKGEMLACEKETWSGCIMGQKEHLNLENKIQELLSPVKAKIAGGNEFGGELLQQLQELKIEVEQVNNKSLSTDYWLILAKVSKTLVEPSHYAEAIYALEDLVVEDGSMQNFEIHFYSAVYYLTYSDSSLAQQHILRAYEIAAELGNNSLKFRTRTLMGVIYDRLGNKTMATNMALDALNFADNPRDLFIALINLADRHRLEQEYAKAEVLLQKSEDLIPNIEESKAMRATIRILLNEKRGWLYKDLGKFSEAIGSFGAAIAGSREANALSEGYFSSVEGLTEIYFAQGKYLDGIALCEAMLETENAGDEVYLKSYNNLAAGYEQVGDYAKAFKYLNKAHDLEHKMHTQRSDSKLRAWEARYNFNIERRDKEIAIQKHKIAELQNKDLKNQIIEGQIEMLRRLAIAAEKRDDETSEHTVRVGKISKHIALLLGLSEDFAETLGFAALFHDIGKIGIPDAILLKPEPLTPKEFLVMQKHTTIGAEILANSRLELLQLAESIALGHHERWDGHGYPNKISGDDIPLAARIVSIADAFDAMTSDRPYRKALEPNAVIEELMKGAGSQFDAIIVDIFLNWLEQKGIAAITDIAAAIEDVKDLGDVLTSSLPIKGSNEQVLYVSPAHLRVSSQELLIVNG